MLDPSLLALLQAVASGQKTPDEAYREITASFSRAEGASGEIASPMAFENLGFASVDHDRMRRCGFPEVIFAQGKTADETVAMSQAILTYAPVVLITRVPPATEARLRSTFPDAKVHSRARLVVIGTPPPPSSGLVLVVSAGTSDLPVAEEAAITAEVMGCRVERIYDVGVAGIHRLMAHQERLHQASVLIVVAGMEGALPSVVGGLVAAPVIAVPTSVGYGASWGGLAALLAMLNSCASGVVVVNIDNGFGAGVAAARILHRREKGSRGEKEEGGEV